ncbi:MAG: HAD domain-containing protein [Bacteroidia bacterium]
MLIFLDIDGVMVPAKSWKRPEILGDGFPAFSSKAISVLNSLLHEDTTIVLTSSHKANYGIEEWKRIFKSRGLEVDQLITLKENVGRFTRKQEIVCWFKDQTVNQRFIIIDDDSSLCELPPALKAHWIYTSPSIGLCDEHIAEINRILQIDLIGV